ncbi:MAG: metallophosphoesterase [Parafilimonas terrae]|nr:metallophosphoesterase [Parafilimonas terrae]
MAATKTLPTDVTVCAVGDVHGCLDELRGMVDYLEAHIISPSRQTTLVLIGDYIDRGPASLV